MTTETILLLVVIILIAGVFPAWPYSRSWGYGPMGVFGLLLAIFLIWAITTDRPLFRSSERGLENAVSDVGRDLKDAGRNVADSVRDATN